MPVLRTTATSFADAQLDGFLDAAAKHADGGGLPAFVEQEFRDFLSCGVLAHGFARLQCEACAVERLVPFSCKERGFCPSFSAISSPGITTCAVSGRALI